jgi:hypothetical protein
MGGAGGMKVNITRHAIDRYLQRVDASLSPEAAKAEMLAASSAIERAAAFGCDAVKLGNGARLILDGLSVVTVLARGCHVGFAQGISRASQAKEAAQ